MPDPGSQAHSTTQMAAKAKAEQEERCERYKAFKAIDGAYRIGDLNALLAALGHPADFPNSSHPAHLGLTEFPLEYAIYWSPFHFLEMLLDRGSDPNYPDQSGFPSLIAALSTLRDDRLGIVRLLLARGADVQQRGLNDWTPLHYAASRDDGEAIELLLANGADIDARTRIDDCTTPVQLAESCGCNAAIRILRGSPDSPG
jgi:ankyrin repeat protein